MSNLIIFLLLNSEHLPDGTGKYIWRFLKIDGKLYLFMDKSGEVNNRQYVFDDESDMMGFVNYYKKYTGQKKVTCDIVEGEHYVDEIEL